MEDKEKLIYDIIKSGLKGISKLGKQQEKMIKDLRKDGYGDIHPFYKDEMKSGISYTHGYTVGHLALANDILDLLKMSEEEIVELNKKNKDIERQNEEYMKNLSEEMDSRLSQNKEDDN